MLQIVIAAKNNIKLLFNSLKKQEQSYEKTPDEEQG
jgi:hypothetical protein